VLLQTESTPTNTLEATQKYQASLLVLIPGDGVNRKNAIRDLIYGSCCNGRRVGGTQMPPINHLYVATTLKEDGHKVDFIDGQVDFPRFQKLDRDNFAGIDFLLMLSSTASYKDDLRTARQVKSKNRKVKVLFFGSHPTFMPESCLREDAIDYVVTREPEMTIRELVRRVIGGASLDDLGGCGYKQNEKPVVNPFNDHFDMNQLPIPDWSLLPKNIDYFNPLVKRMPFATMQTSRGCPAKCIFCTAPFFYGHEIRLRTAENVLREIRYLTNLGYREIFFRDETFTAYKQRNQKICKGILDEKIDVTWIANGRVDMIDRESAEFMKKAGCHMLKFGVETGDDQMLINLQKGATVEQAREAFRTCHETGLDTHAHIVFGGPEETLETINTTLAFIKEIDPTTASFGILTPYPGTKHFEMVQEKFPEILDGTEANMEKLHTTAFYSDALCSLDPALLQGAISRAYRTFYFRPSYFLKWIRKIDSLDEFFRLAIAGSNILTFGITGRK